MSGQKPSDPRDPNAWRPPQQQTQVDKMRSDFGKCVDLFGRWLMGDDIVEEIDKHHGTNLGPMREQIRQKAREVSAEVESAIQTREAAQALRAAPTRDQGPGRSQTGDCSTCRGMGARFANGRPAVCQDCDGTGKQGTRCDACDGNGAVIASENGRSIPKPCRPCNATGRRVG